MAVATCFLRVLVFLVVFSFLLAEDELRILYDNNFEHLTQAATGATTGDWLVVFSKDHSECPQCKDVEDILTKLGPKFHHGHQYYYTSDKYSEESLTAFLKNYDKQPNRKVPETITMFDVIVEDIMEDVKHIIHMRKNAAFIIFFSGILFGLMLMPILKCIADFLISTFTHDEDKKDYDEDEDEKEDEEGEEEKEEEKNEEQKKED